MSKTYTNPRVVCVPSLLLHSVLLFYVLCICHSSILLQVCCTASARPHSSKKQKKSLVEGLSDSAMTDSIGIGLSELHLNVSSHVAVSSLRLVLYSLSDRGQGSVICQDPAVKRV